jgi:hypothetical protein
MHLSKLSRFLFAVAAIGVSTIAPVASADSVAGPSAAASAGANPHPTLTPAPGMIFSVILKQETAGKCTIDSPSITVYGDNGTAFLMAIFSSAPSEAATTWNVEVTFYDPNHSPIGNPINFKGTKVKITPAYTVLYDRESSANFMTNFPVSAVITHATCS